MVWSPISQNNPHFSRDVCSLDAECGWTPIYQGWGCISHQENRSLGAANAAQRVKRPVQTLPSRAQLGSDTSTDAKPGARGSQNGTTTTKRVLGRVGKNLPTWGCTHSTYFAPKKVLNACFASAPPSQRKPERRTRSCGPARKRHRGRVFRSLRKVRPLKSHLDLG